MRPNFRCWRRNGHGACSRCMSVIGATADDICRVRVFRLLDPQRKSRPIDGQACGKYLPASPESKEAASVGGLFHGPSKFQTTASVAIGSMRPVRSGFRNAMFVRRWITVMPVPPSAALPKCLLHRARLFPPQKIPEQLLLLASTERLRLG